MKHLLTCLTIFSFLTLFSQEKHSVTCGGFRCEYTTVQGRINGQYVSYYANGKKRAEGEFKDHLRNGTWTIWDSLGNMKVKRNYSGTSFSESFPIKDSMGNTTHLKRACSYPAPSNIIWEKRVWRFIPNKRANEKLFGADLFGQQIMPMVRKGMLTVYSPGNDQFAVPFEGWTADTSARLIGYRIKEDWYFDAAKSVMDVQIVGLAPVVQRAVSNDTVNLCWIYFPDLKPLLAGTDVSRILYQRQFSSVIYKESNVYDRELKDYLPLNARNAEAEKIEMEMIENEHTLWLDTKQKQGR